MIINRFCIWIFNINNNTKTKKNKNDVYKKIIDFIQKYLHILSPEDKETLQRIHMRLEHIKNLNITFNQMETN